jgi:uncharacterized Zn-finger protein|nr:MAG TPA_asm: zinc-ribbon domain protein [Bacteriophage sp.]
MEEDKTYVCCPYCGKRLFRINKDSVYIKVFLWCKYCKKEIEFTK